MKLRQSISLNSLLLGGFALLAAGILATVNLLTLEPIALAERAAAQKALLEILPANTHDNDLITDTVALNKDWQNQLNVSADAVIYRSRKNHTINAVIIPVVAPDGYSGKIKIIVGVRRDKTIAGVRVLQHTETPGLGDKIDIKKSRWVLSFDNQSTTNPRADLWKVKKDGGHFDQFSGATITPRAMVKQVKNALDFVDAHFQELFDADNTTRLAHKVNP